MRGESELSRAARANAEAERYASSLLLSVRGSNVVATLGIRSHEQLFALTRKQLMKTRNCGRVTTDEIMMVIEEMRQELAPPRTAPVAWGFI